MLTIGLTSAQTAGLTSIPLVCPSAALLVGFPNCSASIANAVIAISAADGSNTTYSKTSTLFDSGTPDMILAPPNDVTLPTTTGTNVLANNEKVLVTLPNRGVHLPSAHQLPEGLGEATRQRRSEGGRGVRFKAHHSAIGIEARTPERHCVRGLLY
jgi:hypothetical protein